MIINDPDNRPKLNLAQPFTRGNKLLVYNFTEGTKARPFIAEVVKAFTEGYNCFQFIFATRDKKGNKRTFRATPAIPHDGGFDEVDAANMAKEVWQSFDRKLLGLLAGTL